MQHNCMCVCAGVEARKIKSQGCTDAVSKHVRETSPHAKTWLLNAADIGSDRFQRAVVYIMWHRMR